MASGSHLSSILIVEDSQGRREIVLDSSVYSVGRDAKCDIRLASQFVSRHHVTLVQLPRDDETYYYRIQPETGVAFHRNYRLDTDFDEVIPAGHGDCVLVTEGFHPVGANPGSNVYFLNYLAGELLDDQRNTPPFDDPDWGWMKDDYEGNKLSLPVF